MFRYFQYNTLISDYKICELLAGLTVIASQQATQAFQILHVSRHHPIDFL